MIRSANIGKELVVTVQNKIGTLAGISKILSDHGINIEGVAGYVINNDAKIMLSTDDNLRASDALKKGGYKALKEHEIIVLELENKAGVLKNITAILKQEDIDIKYIYGTTCAAGCPARINIATSDNEKALVAFRKK